MSNPQSGILPDGSSSAIFLTLKIKRTCLDLTELKVALGKIPELTVKVGSLGCAKCPVFSSLGFSVDFWKRISAECPSGFFDFRSYECESRLAPATSADIFLHIRSEDSGLNHELASKVIESLEEHCQIVEEVSGFRYLDNRDMIGFVDGTENPTGDGRAEVALMSESDNSKFTGGSFVSVQRYVHKMSQWKRLKVSDQEAIVGRSKADNIEFRGDELAPFAHIRRVNLKEDGKGLEILRHSMPYGSTEEKGLYFVAYCRTLDHFDKMLKSMIVSGEVGQYDKLLDFSVAVTGINFFVPSLETLKGI